MEQRPVRVQAEHGRSGEHPPLVTGQRREPVRHQARSVGGTSLAPVGGRPDEPPARASSSTRNGSPSARSSSMAQGGEVGGARGQPASRCTSSCERRASRSVMTAGRRASSPEDGARRLVLAHRGDDEHGQGRYGDRDVGEDGPRVGVGPVEVLEQQQARTAAARRGRGSERPPRRARARDRRLTPSAASRDLRPVREQPRERGAVRSERRRGDLEPGPEGPDEGVGDRVGTRRHPRSRDRSGRHGWPRPPCASSSMSRGLADPGLTADEHDASAAVGGLDKGGAQDRAAPPSRPTRGRRPGATRSKPHSRADPLAALG